MDNNRPQNQRVKYTGRFASEADSRPYRAAAPARTRTSSAQPQPARRPSGFAAAEPAKRRPAESTKRRTAAPARREAAAPTKRRITVPPAAAKSKETPKPEKQIRNKRGQKAPQNKKLILLIGGAVLVVLIVVLVLIFGGRGGTVHQLPKVERGSSEAFEPEETNAPEGAAEAAVVGAAALEAELAGEESPSFDDADAIDDLDDIDLSAFDELDALDDLEAFGDEEGLDEASLFGGGDIDDEDLLRELMALEGADE